MALALQFETKNKNKWGSCDTNRTKERKKHDRHLSMKTIKYKESSRHRNVKSKRQVYKINYSPGKAQQSLANCFQQMSLRLVITKKKTKQNYSHVTDIRKASVFPYFPQKQQEMPLVQWNLTLDRQKSFQEVGKWKWVCDFSHLLLIPQRSGALWTEGTGFFVSFLFFLFN